MKRIVFHVEGGQNKNEDARFRQAFRTFFTEIDVAASAHGVSLKFIMEGPRRTAYERFCHESPKDADEWHVLLVDAEDLVKQSGLCWKHIEERAADQFERPNAAEEAQCQLMVQAMEAWFFADADALTRYYGKEFQASSLPKTNNVENIPKARHISALEAATKGTQKKRYHKTHHAPDILAQIDPAKVRNRAPHCDRIFVDLINKLG